MINLRAAFDEVLKGRSLDAAEAEGVIGEILDDVAPDALVAGFLVALKMKGEAAAEARKYYCGTIGVEFEHIDDTERRRWIAARMESEPAQPDRGFILERLVRAELVSRGQARRR